MFPISLLLVPGCLALKCRHWLDGGAANHRDPKPTGHAGDGRLRGTVVHLAVRAIDVYYSALDSPRCAHGVLRPWLMSD